MKIKNKEETEIKTFQDLCNPVIARIVKSKAPGKIYIKYKKNKPSKARLLSGVNRQSLIAADSDQREVLVVFEDGDVSKPIIIGIMENLIDDFVSLENFEDQQEKAADTNYDNLILEANHEILLKCGKGQIQINKEGEIRIRGINIVSRARETNKIKGGNVRIN